VRRSETRTRDATRRDKSVGPRSRRRVPVARTPRRSIERDAKKYVARKSRRTLDATTGDGRLTRRGSTRPSATLKRARAMHNAVARLSAGIDPHLLILCVPVLVVRERGRGSQGDEMFLRDIQEFAVGLHLRGFPTGIHHVQLADFVASRASEQASAVRVTQREPLYRGARTVALKNMGSTRAHALKNRT